MRRVLMALALAAWVPAQAEAACIGTDDARTLFAVALPDAITGLASRCASVLPRDAFLPNEAAALAQRYRREAPVDPARARKAIEAASGQDLSAFASDDTITALADRFVEKAIRDRVATRDCATIDGLVALAAPMRADAMAEAVLLALQIAGPDAALPGGLSICRGHELTER